MGKFTKGFTPLYVSPNRICLEEKTYSLKHGIHFTLRWNSKLYSCVRMKEMLVVKVGFWSALKYLRKNKQKDEISLVSCYNGRGCRFFCLHLMNYINEVE